ncbi:MAG: Penicillin-binding protein 2, partial [Cyanobacteriota bacterium erpe_2018_sw_39hr_WHONDRS-SW48-000098_B_bin.30]|nr:Penicillin-binding protein 2 [Cyanobacteriota bacterium erpe_2018_sw_39hr_WHONDRS-SW48-000098_B_bin.30]
DKPRIAISAFVEHGGHGGSTAAPMVKPILEKFFSVARPITDEQKIKAGEAVAPAAPVKPARAAKRH